jgi:hypothetical protein
MSNTYKINLPTQSYSNYSIGTSAGYNGTWTTTSAATSTPTLTVADGVMTVKGNPASLDVKGNVVINGIDLEERLKTIEKVLMIPERDAKIEAKYPSLKKKYDEYIDSLSKYRMWESIKGQDNV